jgi:hypothetical protein
MNVIRAGVFFLSIVSIPLPVFGQTVGTPPQPDSPLSPYQSNPPIYAIPLMDGRTVLVWWDARSDPQHPRWVCEVPPRRDGTEAGAIVLPRGRGDWCEALDRAATTLKGQVADGM